MNRIQTNIIKQAQDAPEQLNEWEHEFIDSLAKKEEDYELSEKQNHALNQISQKLI